MFALDYKSNFDRIIEAQLGFDRSRGDEKEITDLLQKTDCMGIKHFKA